MGSFQLEDFAAGWIGGAASVIVGYPLDTVKTRLQAGVGYGNTLSCIRMVYRKESVFGFFKGMSFPLASIAVYNSVVFGVFSNTQRFLSQLHSREPEASPPHTLSDLLLASMVAGVVSVGLGTPVDLIKIRLQMQTQAFRESVFQRHHGECCAGLPHERSHVPGVRALAAGHQRELPGGQPLSARARAGVMDQGLIPCRARPLQNLLTSEPLLSDCKHSAPPLPAGPLINRHLFFICTGTWQKVGRNRPVSHDCCKLTGNSQRSWSCL
ncbi:solute carrier family 25 member 48 isoform X5 [Myotis myotis]|uniref:solute carrier family 25 member 48 isoform X5 n=1 Tax=Myotis myotis TaxID=51298 RepID=UPI001748B624|nr:solute carrier family 25 member 48 isoform X5 [Myotis myotis]